MGKFQLWLVRYFGEWERPVDMLSCGTGVLLVIACKYFFGA